MPGWRHDAVLGRSIAAGHTWEACADRHVEVYRSVAFPS